MPGSLHRRDFLKISSLLPLSMSTLKFMQNFQAGKKNIIVIVFDAWTAHNVSLYGYSRETMPNLARLAEKAIVYHSHFAGSNFTSSGTATILTGTLPWTHRALTADSTVDQKVAPRNIFNALQGYYRTAYTHNGWAYTLLKQFEKYIDDLIPRKDLFVKSPDAFIQTLFEHDEDTATVSWARNISLEDQGYAYSLFLSRIFQKWQDLRLKNLRSNFPLGLPTRGLTDGFLLEDAVDSIHTRLVKSLKPVFGYFHFLPPHAPYRTHVEFYDRFKSDGYKPAEKVTSIFAKDPGNVDLAGDRKNYDEYLLYVDREFGRFFDLLEQSGLLEDSYVVLTSDHGEMFERGISGHSTPVLYQPLIRVPLMIFEPGRRDRLDIHSHTSALDILPTILHMAGQAASAAWAEGVLLPPYNTDVNENRSIYSVFSYYSEKDQVLGETSVAMIKGKYKLVYYFGYKETGGDLVELFDIETDPEELQDLSFSQAAVTDELLTELKAKLVEVNKPYI
jgi:arylsulfatase A-like enzyme